MTTRSVDLAVLRSIIETLAKAADDLDALGESLPSEVRAGPFAAEVAALMTMVTANYLELIMRLRLAAHTVLQDLVNYAGTRCHNKRLIDQVGRCVDEGRRGN